LVRLAWLVLCFIGNTAPSRAGDVSYVRELQQRANTAALYQQRYWHLLLHYRATITGGYESEADEPGFFLAPNGKTDPQAELAATLVNFFPPSRSGARASRRAARSLLAISG
jgi:hypothetical protein